MSRYTRENAWYLDDVDELLTELEALDVTSVGTKPPIYPRAPTQKNPIETAVKPSAISSPIHPRSTALLPQYGWFTDTTEGPIQSGAQKARGDAYVDRPTTARPSSWQTLSGNNKISKSSIFQKAAVTTLRQQLSQAQIKDSIDTLTDSFNL